MRRVSTACIAAVAASLLGAACIEVPWGEQGPTEPSSDAKPASNALVVVLGQQAHDVAAGRLTSALTSGFPEGVSLTGELDVSVPEIAIPVVGGDALQLRWAGWRLTTGVVELSPAPGGVDLRLGVEAEAQTIAVTLAEGAPLCTVELSSGGGVLALRASLTADKFRRARAKAAGEPTLELQEPQIVSHDCPVEEIGGVGTSLEDLGAAIGFELAARVAGDLVAALGDGLWLALPDALGLSLAGSLTLQTGLDDSIGAGTARVRVRAPEQSSTSGWAQLVDGQLMVPWEVTLEATRHPCATGPEPGTPWATAVPPTKIYSGVGLMVSLQLARRALHTAWSLGLVCGDRMTGDLRVDPEELAAVWPALQSLPEDTTLHVRLWPVRRPTLDVRMGLEGPELVLPDGVLAVEVLAELDGARVRAATVQLAAEVDARLEVAGDGTVWMRTTDVKIVGSGSTPGLVEGPDLLGAGALAELVLEDLSGRFPLWRLPALPSESALSQVGWQGDYLVFSPVLPD